MCIRMYLITYISIRIIFNNDNLRLFAIVIAVETFVEPNED